jgi:hypothetical protein
LYDIGAKRAFDVAVSNIFGMCPSQISLLYFLHYCNAGGSFAKLIDSENGGAQARKVKVYHEDIYIFFQDFCWIRFCKKIEFIPI